MAGGSPLMGLAVNTGLENATAAADWYNRSSQARVQNVTEPYQISQAKSLARQSELKTATDEIATKNAQRWDELQQGYIDKTKAAGENPPEAPATPAPAATLPAAPATAASKATTPLATAATPSAAPLTAAVVPLHTPEITAIIEAAKPNDPNGAKKWDDALQNLADKGGQPWATQYKGMYGKAAQMQQAIANDAGSQVNKAAQSQLATTQSAAGTPTPAAQQPSLAQRGISPVTGKYSAELAEMMILDPERTGKIVKMQALAKFQETGDLNYLRAYASDVYNTAITATNDLEEGQRKNFEFKMQTVGLYAKGVMDAGREWGPDDPKTLATFRRAVVEQQKLGFITPQHATEMLALKQVPWGEIGEGMSHATAVTKAMEIMQQAQKGTADEYQSLGGVEGGGVGILNRRTGDITVKPVTLAGKTPASLAVYQFKREQWLKDHPNATEDEADRYAENKVPLNPAQIQIAAANVAGRLAAASGDPASFDLKGKTAEIAAGIQAAQDAERAAGAAAGAGAGGGGRPQFQVTQVDPNVHPALKGYGAHGLATLAPSGRTAAQNIIISKIPGGLTPQNIGTDRDHPWPFTSDEDYAKIPATGNVWTLAPDGVIVRKPK